MLQAGGVDCVERAVPVTVLPSPLGRLALCLTPDGLLAGIEFIGDDRPVTRRVPAIARTAVETLLAYFDDPSSPPDLPPMAPAPTGFQQRVREALLAIPPGQLRTYGELAAALGSAPRAVGQACRRNPIPILVPCHRVVAAGGPGGYGGEMAGPRWRIKARLLALEGVDLKNRKTVTSNQ